MLDSYLLYKIIHLLGVVLLLGNIIVTAYWKVMADRNGDPMVIAFAQRLVTLTDYVFTAGGAILIVIGGNGMSSTTGIGEAYWLSWGVWLFAASGIIWVLVLIPVQFKQARMAKAFERSTVVPNQYWRLSRMWLYWGSFATVLPLINLYWMIFKPTGV